MISFVEFAAEIGVNIRSLVVRQFFFRELGIAADCCRMMAWEEVVKKIADAMKRLLEEHGLKVVDSSSEEEEEEEGSSDEGDDSDTGGESDDDGDQGGGGGCDECDSSSEDDEDSE